MCKIKHDMEYIPEKGVSVMGHQVFISYSTKDTTQAEWVRKILENNGITCWIAPRNIPGGSNYAREIPAAIRECQVFVLMLSHHSESSIWVSKELDLAVNCQIQFLASGGQLPKSDHSNDAGGLYHWR